MPGGHCDHMGIGFTTTYAISVYHHWSGEFEPRSWWGVLDTTLCDKVCQWLVTDLGFLWDLQVSSTNITEILLKVALNTIAIILTHIYQYLFKDGLIWVL